MTLIEQIKDLINRVENARNFDGSEGKWVTIKGTHVFIPDGKSVEEVMEEKGWGSESKGTEKKSKKSHEDIIADFDKKYDVDKNDKGESWYDRASVSEIKTDLKSYKDTLDEYQKEIDRVDKLDDKYKTGAMWQHEIKPRYEEYKKAIPELKEKIGYLEAHLNKKSPETPKEGKRERRDVSPEDVGLEKTLEGGIKETHDQYGRTIFTKGNKWANVSSNGGRSDSWIAAYGLTHKSAISWEREKGVTEEQLLNSRWFKTEKGARKWALEQLKRITADNSLEEAFTEALAEIILEQ